MNIKIENVISNLKEIPDLTPQELEKLSSYFEYEKVRRKSIVLDKEEVTDKVIYVISGCLRLYCSEDNREHTINFAPNDYWITDFNGFLKRSSTCMMIDSIIDTEFLTLTHKNRERVFSEFPQVERYFLDLIERNAAYSQTKQLNDKKHDARERYEDFCNTYPSLVGRVKDKHVASFIGVTPEFFSKMINSKQF